MTYYKEGSRSSLIERFSQRIRKEKRPSRDTGIEALKVDRVTNSREIHADGLSGVKRLEPAFEVVEGRLSVSGNSGFVGEIESALRIVVVLCARADDVCI